MVRRAVLFLGMLALAACVNGRDLNEPAVPLGDFSLGHNVVVAPHVARVPTSRELPVEDLIASVQGAVEQRFGRYEGPKDYHFGLSIEGYNLAAPGVPVLLSPKTAMIVRLTVWDDAKGIKLNPEPAQFTVVEEFSGGNIVGSGLTKTAEEQLEEISRNVAKTIENYLVGQQEKFAWFTDAAEIDTGEKGEVPLPR